MNNALVTSFWESGWFGRAILIILFSLSIYAWAIIAMKWRTLKEINSNSNRFLSHFNKAQSGLFSIKENQKNRNNSPFQDLYNTICNELNLLFKMNGSKQITNMQLSTLNEIASCTISDQVIALEKYLIVLATTASISPLLGLLGTVWGVLISFRGMSTLGSASLSVVAPGISEALVTTVAGLIVAIPALIAYNWITNQIRTITRKLENFSIRLISYIQLNHINTSSTYEQEPTF